MIRAVIFAMDGTVFDTEKIYYASLAHVAKDTPLAKELDEVLLAISGMNRADIYAYLKRRYGEDFPAESLFDARDELVLSRIRQEGLTFKPGFPQIFDDLKAAGYLVALATSTHRERMEWYLSMTGLENTFDRIMTGESVEHSKPAPDIFLQCAEAMGLSPVECVVVEDSRNGVLAGVNAKMRTVMIPDMQKASSDLREVLWHCLEEVTPLTELIRQENQKIR